jgi:hypothetical protein
MTAAVLGMLADMQAQIEALDARVERAEERVGTEWVESIAWTAIGAYKNARGLRVIGGEG